MILVALVLVAPAFAMDAGQVPTAKPSAPRVVRDAAAIIPMDPADIVVLEHVDVHLRETYGRSAQKNESVARDCVAFVVGDSLPIYINARSNEYRLLARLYEKAPAEAARMLASTLYHEAQHLLGRDELSALIAQVKMLEYFQARGELTTGEGYLKGKQQQLRAEENRSRAPLSKAEGRAGVFSSNGNASVSNMRVPGLAHLYVRRAIQGAQRRLADEGCRAVLFDLTSEAGQPLRSILADRGLTPEEYLGSIAFVDGSRMQACTSGQAFAGMRRRGDDVVYLCSRRFRELAQRDPLTAEAVVIHEMLHTLGLGESPPTSWEITTRVLQRCVTGERGRSDFSR